jgi:hypothetical protein
MTLDNFIIKYNGRFIDFDGKYGCQCTDLIRQYLLEVLKLDPFAIPAVTYAKQMYTNYWNNKYFKRVTNTPTGVPKKGDIVIWGWRWPVTGIAGHVAIFSGGNTSRFISFDQNYPTRQPCKFVNHSYTGVLGWLSPIASK